MARAKTTDKTSELVIEELRKGHVAFWIKGTSPMIYHAMSAPTKRVLLNPPGRKTTVEKQQSVKHDPLNEYRYSVYRRRGDGPTRLVVPATMLKAAMCNAALEVPGAKKTQIGRLVWIVGDQIDVYGIPEMFMATVRNSDMNHTPDVRTRAILPEWCCKVEIEFVAPTLNEVGISRLLATAGVVMGIGDFRQGKGAGNYGCFEIVNEADVKAIIKSGGTKAQDDALETPGFYDADTEELYTWFTEEVEHRGQTKQLKSRVA